MVAWHGSEAPGHVGGSVPGLCGHPVCVCPPDVRGTQSECTRRVKTGAWMLLARGEQRHL